VLCVSLAGCSFELHDQFGGYSRAVFPLDALRLGPARTSVVFSLLAGPPASAAGEAAGAAAHPSASPHVGCQRVPLLLGVFGVRVDLVVRAVESEADGPLGRAASMSSINRVCTFWPRLLRFSRWRTMAGTAGRTSAQPYRRSTRLCTINGSIFGRFSMTHSPAGAGCRWPVRVLERACSR
jgi:hypothetical protein